MKKVFVSIVILYFFEHTISQYDVPYNVMQQGYQYPYHDLQYEKYHQDYQNRRWNEDNEDYNEYDENSCACDKCDELKPGCLSLCPNCWSSPQSIIPQNYFFLPYPYPYPVTPKETSTKTSTTTTQLTTISTTTVEATTLETSTETSKTTVSVTIQESLSPEEYVMTMSPFHVKRKIPYTITSLRKTKPHRLPKYRIVPISDTFAEKLMLQIRNMRVLHPHRNYSRNVEEISRYKYL